MALLPQQLHTVHLVRAAVLRGGGIEARVGFLLVREQVLGVRRAEDSTTALQELQDFLALLHEEPVHFKSGVVRHEQPHIVGDGEPLRVVGFFLRREVHAGDRAVKGLRVDGTALGHDVVLGVARRGQRTEVRVVLRLQVDKHNPTHAVLRFL